jgi:hypothetical protein
LQGKAKAKPAKKTAALDSEDEDGAMSMSDSGGDSDFEAAPKKV